MDTIALWEEEIANERSHYFENLWTNIDYVCESIEIDHKLIEMGIFTEGNTSILNEGVWATVKEKIKKALSMIKEFFTKLINKIKEFVTKNKKEAKTIENKKEDSGESNNQEKIKKLEEEKERAKEEFEKKKEEINNKYKDSESKRKALAKEAENLKKELEKIKKDAEAKDEEIKKIKDENEDLKKIKQNVDDEKADKNRDIEKAKSELEELVNSNSPIYTGTQFAADIRRSIKIIDKYIRAIDNKDYNNPTYNEDELDEDIKDFSDEKEWFRGEDILDSALRDPENFKLASSNYVKVMDRIESATKQIDVLNKKIDDINIKIDALDDVDNKGANMYLKVIKILQSTKMMTTKHIKEMVKTSKVLKRYMEITRYV